MERKKGFTIVELLTVMGVIAVLIGLMVPALALVKDYSKRIQQKAQFHGIDMGLQMFKTEFGSYPDSSDNFITGKEASIYCGSNKLAEAMVGLDLIGFHPNADFRSDGQNTITDNFGVQVPNHDVYDTTGSLASWQTGAQNIDARKGPFVETEHANAFRMDEVYANIGPTNFNQNFAPPGAATAMYPLVLCDVYAQKRSGTGGKKTGTPILYYRAHENFKFQDSAKDNNGSGFVDDDDIYSYLDNQELLALGRPDNNSTFAVVTAAVTGVPAQEFDNMIRNENVTTVRRPYRSDSYILISAGKDGDFGTADDVFNFDKEVTE
ncbi:MAG: type II secretion system GspH family protein [Phycisphaerae bacterium]|nr:type II secretion system GspH family protein [Phycisphaerae bacterium]